MQVPGLTVTGASGMQLCSLLVAGQEAIATDVALL